MPTRTDVRNNSGLVIGFVQDFGSEIIASNFKKGFAGRYSKAADWTFDHNGKPYCKGDATQTLVREREKE